MATHGDSGWDSVEILLELQQRWHTALSARLERYLGAASPADKRDAVRAAFRDTAQAHLTLRLVLDELAAHPVLALPRRWEHVMLADAAGLSDPFERSREVAAVGATLVADLHPSGAARRAEYPVRHG